jgi:predicted ATPase/class 3 adenylate cyclase
MAELPAGTVTLLFTDIEGSTKLLQELGDRYADVLAEHRRVLRQAFHDYGGVEVDTQGDAFFYAFAEAPAAVEAARRAQLALADGSVRVRIGIHTGEPIATEEGYVGIDVHTAARIMGAGHGGQVLVSGTTRTALNASDNLSLSDLGEHRLKDLEHPVWIFQLGSETFPPLKTISNTNLPRPASSFVGRARELEEVLALLREPGVRLLTLTGPGGSGKTRLAIEAAAELVGEYPNGVFWVGLAALRDPTLVTETIAQTLGAKDGLEDHIGERELLLLLDNLEQVVEAAPEPARLLESCPNLALLVTSRELLRVRGEVEYEVPPLAESEAVELFCERARIEPSDEVGELCVRLDNLPLAVELAAARAKVLSPRQILERLSKRLDLLKGSRDVDPRQQTLRATIAWSHELLTEAEQRLFRRLSVFAGGCALEAAEEVAGAELDGLQSLVDKSLLRHTAERFWMLETIREFAFERLEEAGESDGIGRRHAEHFLGLAEEAALHLDNPPEQRRWLERVDADLNNVRTALAWSSDGHGSDIGLRLAASLREFWFVRGFYSEGLGWLDSLLARGVAVEPESRLRALQAASDLAIKTDDVALAGRYAEQVLAHAREAGDTIGMARALLILGLATRVAGDAKRGDAFLAEGLALAREAGDLVLAARILANLGLNALEAGEFKRARRFFRQSLSLSEEVESEQGIARASIFLGGLALHEGHVEDAFALYRPGLALAHRLGWTEAVVYALGGLACAYAELGQIRKAANLIGAESRLIEELHLRLERYERDLRDRAAAEVGRKMDAERLSRMLAEGRSMSLDEAVQLALNGDA